MLAVLEEQDIFDKFHKRHSTELALLMGADGILVSTDTAQGPILILLDLGVAFDMVDHNSYDVIFFFAEHFYVKEHVRLLTNSCFFQLRNIYK